MRVTVAPQRVEIAENQTFTVHVTITNTGTVIGGYHLRVLGADPSWVRLEAENLSLFPDTSQTVDATISIPPGVGAGDRRVAVQVRELTPPHAISVGEIELVVPAREAIRMALSPMTVTCGKHGRFSVVAENTGNTPISMAPVGSDPEAKISFEFLPAILDLAPGEHVITDLRTSAKRRWFGSPVVRPFSLAAVPPEDLARLQAPPPPPPADEAAVSEPPPEPPKPLAQGTIVQKPRLGRGALSLLALLLAVSVFATVITIALSRLVGVSAADRDLAIQVASARSAGAGAGSSMLAGTVKLLSDGSPAAGVAVEVFAAGDLTQPVISTATKQKGDWAVSALSAGSYKISFRGAGFAQVWYPNALTGEAAKAVQLDAGQKVTDLAVALGGLPATISGQVTGADVSGAILTVQVPQQYLKPVVKSTAPGTTTPRAAPRTGAADAGVTTSPPGLRFPGRAAPPTGGAAGSDATGADASGANAAPTTGASATPTTGAGGGPSAGATDGGVLRTIPIGSDGLFTLSDLPSPAVYDLIVSKAGYATDTQRVDLSGGETRNGVVLVLRTGDGLISGTVTGPDGGLGGAVVTATSGGTTVRTLTLTTGTVGRFSLRGLVTPATYTITVTHSNYTTVTSTLSLASGQKLDGVLLSLSKAAGTLSGTVTTLADGKPASGVTVTIASGSSSKLSTVTQSGKTAGQWTVAGLPIPGTYTVTFSRSDLQSQTVAVALNSAGKITSGSDGSNAIDVAMRSAYAVVEGTVHQEIGNTTKAAGEATITLSSGDENYTVTSASMPADNVGHYEIAHVKPGTYTLSASRKGTSPTTVIITVAAGQDLTYNPMLIQPASITGVVTDDGDPLADTEVDLYLSSQYPATVYRSTKTGSNGRYTFTAVDAPQAYVVEVRSATAGPLVSGTIVLEASVTGTLNLTVGATPTKSKPSEPSSSVSSSSPSSRPRTSVSTASPSTRTAPTTSTTATPTTSRTTAPTTTPTTPATTPTPAGSSTSAPARSGTSSSTTDARSSHASGSTGAAGGSSTAASSTTSAANANDSGGSSSSTATSSAAASNGASAAGPAGSAAHAPGAASAGSPAEPGSQP